MAPDKIVWVSYDLWPNHIWEAAHLGTAAARLQDRHQASARNTNLIIQKFYRTLYNRLEQIMLVSDADLEQVRQVVPEHPGLVMGDTRFDSVIERREQLDPPQWPEDWDEDLFVAVVPGRDEECIYKKKMSNLRSSGACPPTTHRGTSSMPKPSPGHPHGPLEKPGPSPAGVRILLIDTIGLLASSTVEPTSRTSVRDSYRCSLAP